jgi:hypothetical protein
MRKFFGMSGIDFNDREPEIELPRPSPRMAANTEFFLRYDAGAARRYRLDLAALKAAATRIVPAVGQSSPVVPDGRLFHAGPARALAERLGVQVVEFPGGHNGYALRPKAFSSKLDIVLRSGG